MTQSNFVNPNGLPADQQITSARDMAILARTVLREFPEYNYYWSLPGIRFGKRVYRNYNTLIGRYDGTDGMKTGFICASGFNVVATATRDGKRLIAVVLGSPSPAVRAVKAAQLFERGFQVRPLSWLTPGLGQVDALQPVNVDPPNLRDEMCGKGRRRPPSEEAENDPLADVAADSPYAVFLSTLRGAGNANAGRCCRTCGWASRCASSPARRARRSTSAPAEAKAKGKGKTKTAKSKKSGEPKATANADATSAPTLAHSSTGDAGDDRRRRARRKPRRRRPRKPRRRTPRRKPRQGRRQDAKATPKANAKAKTPAKKSEPPAKQ